MYVWGVGCGCVGVWGCVVELCVCMCGGGVCVGVCVPVELCVPVWGGCGGAVCVWGVVQFCEIC